MPTPAKKSIARSLEPSGALTAATLPPIAPTRAERLDALCAEFGGTYTRSILADGTVQVSMELASGDRIAGRGPDTEAALVSLESRLSRFRQEG